MPAASPSGAPATDATPEIDLDTEILWERSAAGDHGFHAWIACESGAAMAMRRHLTGAVGIDRRAVACMGYWRLGRALD